MASKFSDLVAYFEAVATEHVEIRHSSLSKHFYRFELEELLMGLATDINFPALVLEGYDFSYGDSKSDNIMKQRNGAFMLLGHVGDSGDFAAIHTLYDQLEEIGDDILVRMREDKASGDYPVLRHFDIAESDGMTVRVTAYGQYGLRFTFSMKTPVNNIVDTTKWNRSQE